MTGTRRRFAQRFVYAQEPVYRQVLEELRRGRKASHWMWFVFPQIAGLGASAIGQRFAIVRAEAAAYLEHDVLGHARSNTLASSWRPAIGRSPTFSGRRTTRSLGLA
jgi:uncharacterized protein (DUF1810 family)